MVFGLPFRLRCWFLQVSAVTDFFAPCSILTTSFWIPLNLLLIQKRPKGSQPCLDHHLGFFRALPFWRSTDFTLSPLAAPWGREQHLCVFLKAEVSDPADRMQVNLNFYHRQEPSIPLDKWGQQDSEGLNTYLSVAANEWWSQGYILVLSNRQRACLPFVPRRGQCPPDLK